VSDPELEFKTNRHAIDARELAALVDAVLSIVREVCEQVPELMRAIISVYVRPQCPATVVLAHFTGAYPELSARLTERLCALSPELPVTAPTHVRLHFSIHPEYMPLARSGVSIA
jgi:hypothetical protein